MLFYDNEFNVLSDVHELGRNECLILSDSEGSENYFKAAKIIDRILKEDGLRRWGDNSKSKMPPDLINHQDKIAIEVMRVDDHSPDGKINPNLAKQRKLRKEINPIVEQYPEGTRVLINSVTDLPTDIDHNYKFYYESFSRTVNKHLLKLDKYKSNFPEYKIIFLVLDETSGVYIEHTKKYQKQILGKPHFVFCDNRFLNAFVNSELDYLIWFIPYNHYETTADRIDFPRLIFFDIKNFRNNTEVPRIDYDEVRMIKNEL